MTTYIPLNANEAIANFPESEQLRNMRKSGSLIGAQETIEFKKPNSSTVLPAEDETNVKPSRVERKSVRTSLNKDKTAWTQAIDEVTPKGTRKHTEIIHRETDGYITESQFEVIEKIPQSKDMNVRKSYIWDEDNQCFIDKHTGERIHGADLDYKPSSLVFDQEGKDHTNEIENDDATSLAEVEEQMVEPKELVEEEKVEEVVVEKPEVETETTDKDSKTDEDTQSTKSANTFRNLFAFLTPKKSKTMKQPNSPAKSNHSSNTLKVPGAEDDVTVQNNLVNLADEQIDEKTLDQDLDKLRQTTMAQSELDALAIQLNADEAKSNHSQKSHTSVKSYTSVGGTYYSRTYVYKPRPMNMIHHPQTKIYSSYLAPIYEVNTPHNGTKVTTVVHEPKVTYTHPVTYDRRERVSTRVFGGERVRYISPSRVTYVSPARRYVSPTVNTYYRLS